MKPTDTTSPTGPVKLDHRAAPWQDLGVDGGRADIQPLVTTAHSRTLGAGFARFEDVAFDWTLTYDECIHVLEGEMEVRHDGGTLRAAAGEVVFLPSGSAVTYAFPGACRIFYAAYPVDWQERMEEAGDA